MSVSLKGLEGEWALQEDFRKDLGELARQIQGEPKNLDLAHDFWQHYLAWESKNTDFRVKFGTVPACQLDKALVEDDHRKGRMLLFDPSLPYAQLDIVYPRLRKNVPPQLGEMPLVDMRPGPRWTTIEASYDTVPEESMRTWGPEDRYGAGLSTFVFASMVIGRLGRLSGQGGSHGPTRHLDGGVTASLLLGTLLDDEPVVVHHCADDFLFIAKQSDFKMRGWGLVQGVRSER